MCARRAGPERGAVAGGEPPAADDAVFADEEEVGWEEPGEAEEDALEEDFGDEYERYLAEVESDMQDDPVYRANVLAELAVRGATGRGVLCCRGTGVAMGRAGGRISLPWDGLAGRVAVGRVALP